jgi:hypothetical protein
VLAKGAAAEKCGRAADVTIWCLVYCLSDADGNPLYTERDFARLQSIPVSVVEAIEKVASRLNRMDAADDSKKN